MQDQVWWVSVTGQPEGPFAPEQIAAQHVQGRVDAATPVWRDGMADWLPAGRTDLAPLLGPARSAPPPPRTSGWVDAPTTTVTRAAATRPAGGRQQPVGPDQRTAPAPSWQHAPPPSWQQPPVAASATNGLSIAAIVCGLIAVLFFPVVLGPAAIICAGLALSRQESRARLAMTIAVGGTVLGFILGAVMYTVL